MRVQFTQVPLEVPFCFYPKGYGGYRYVNVTAAPWGLTAYMQRMFYSPYPDDIPLLRMDIKMETKQRLHIKVQCVLTSLGAIFLLSHCLYVLNSKEACLLQLDLKLYYICSSDL